MNGMRAEIDKNRAGRIEAKSKGMWVRLNKTSFDDDMVRAGDDGGTVS